MTRPKVITFCEYRYQLLPLSQEVQMDLDGEVRTLEDLKRMKNDIFRKVIQGTRSFHYSYSELEHKLVHDSGSTLVLQFGPKRGLTRTTRDFRTEEIENWPTLFVAFENNPRIQKCLVQHGGGFQHTSTMVNILQENLNRSLAHRQLSVVFEPIFQAQRFWDLVARYEQRITQIEFDLVSPNMSNISATLKVDLAKLNRSTNTQRTCLKLNSDKNSYLTPTHNDEIIDSLVKYSAQGGGNISIRAKGVSKKIHTSKGVNEITIADLTLKGASPEELGETFRNLLQ